MKKEFTKSDLENGMIVQQRDGDVGFIVGDRIYFVGKLEDGEADGWEWLEDYRNDLTHPAEEWLENGDEYDIIKVWSNLGSLATEAVKRVVKNNRPIWAVCRNGDNTEDQYMDTTGINLWINWESGNFRFAWMIPHTVFKIVSGDMSPVWRLDHLEKMYNKFLREVTVHGK